MHTYVLIKVEKKKKKKSTIKALELSNQNVNKAIKVDPRRDREQLKR